MSLYNGNDYYSTPILQVRGPRRREVVAELGFKARQPDSSSGLRPTLQSCGSDEPHARVRYPLTGWAPSSPGFLGPARSWPTTCGGSDAPCCLEAGTAAMPTQHGPLCWRESQVLDRSPLDTQLRLLGSRSGPAPPLLPVQGTLPVALQGSWAHLIQGLNAPEVEGRARKGLSLTFLTSGRNWLNEFTGFSALCF